MSATDSTRRDFIKGSAIAGIGASLVGLSGQTATAAGSGAQKAVTLPSGVKIAGGISTVRPRPKGQMSVHDLTTQPLEKVRVAVIGLHRGMTHVESALGIEFAEVVAVCDIVAERANGAADACVAKGRKRPAVFSGTEHIWEKMVEMDGIDAVYIATPWEWHVPMALKSMQMGKHAFVEVSAAVTVEDCWRLVDTSEKTRKHCVILENCCYGENELFMLNMAREGVFGELNHAECSYIHDLRGLLFTTDSEGDWRREYHKQYNGNLYPTHGLGPVSEYLGLGRGDQFKFLVSVSSPERGLTKQRADHNPGNGKYNGETYYCGDMNTSILKTELGRTIMLQHDVVSPRPYSRINALCGDEATFFDYPPRFALNSPHKYGLETGGSESWITDRDMAKMRELFTHPLWKKLAERAKGGGHGGMDFVMNWRLLDCLRAGRTPDSVVYDAAAWSCLIEISSYSVATGSMPVTIPDFTRGLWKDIKPLGVAEKSA